ncbi:hypothetical protein, partial [Aeromonas caviae]|uniref:hypothetical protein n=1 Tax=Aeromonas caviae TaxID=648 RepID=UPI001CC44F32
DGKPAGPSETLHGYRVSFPGEWLWHSEGVALLGSVIYPSARQSKSSITMSYQQLTEGQRYQLSVLRAQGMSIL